MDRELIKLRIKLLNEREVSDYLLRKKLCTSVYAQQTMQYRAYNNPANSIFNQAPSITASTLPVGTQATNAKVGPVSAINSRD